MVKKKKMFFPSTHWILWNGTCFDFWCGTPSQIIGKLEMKMQDDASLFTAVWRTRHIVGIHKVYHNMYSNKVHQEKGLKVIPRALNKSLPGILPHLFRVFRSSHCHTYYGMTGLDHFIIQFFLVGGSPPQNFWSDGISTPFNWLCWLNPLQ